MRNTRSTRMPAPEAVQAAESPGVSGQLTVPVLANKLIPVCRIAAAVSNAAEPGRPGVSLRGNASFHRSQMLHDAEPSAFTAFGRLAVPPLDSASDMLSK